MVSSGYDTGMHPLLRLIAFVLASAVLTAGPRQTPATHETTLVEIVSVEPEEFFPTDLVGKLVNDVRVRYRIEPFVPGALRLELTDELSGRRLWQTTVDAKPTGVILCPKGISLTRLPFKPSFTVRRPDGQETNRLASSIEERMALHAAVPGSVRAGTDPGRVRLEGDAFWTDLDVQVSQYDSQRKRYRHLARVRGVRVTEQTIEIESDPAWFASTGELWFAVVRYSMPDEPIPAESRQLQGRSGANAARMTITREEPTADDWRRPPPAPFRLDGMKPFDDVSRLRPGETQVIHLFGGGFEKGSEVVAHVRWKSSVVTHESTPLETEWVSDTELRATLVPQVYGFSSINAQLFLKPAGR